MPSGFVLLDDQLTGDVRQYSQPLDIVQANDPKAVRGAFAALQYYHEHGCYLAGYMAYELGYVLEPHLNHLMPDTRSGPLLQFGVFKDFEMTTLPAQADNKLPNLQLSPSWNLETYREKFEKVIAYIEAGDVYQINLTFPMQGLYGGTARALYEALRHRQAGQYGGVVSLGGADIISLSPELFFKKTGVQMDMKPMKGTARRQADPVQDAALRDAMKLDAKSQAENLMIVDLLRNDLSRIAQRGSVKVPELFALETYPTLHQMTSRVQAKLRGDMVFFDIFKSLFPCGSVTGAPKIRAMEIISELEEIPRGAYCGGLGYVDPSGDACFNVAIRTLTLSRGRVTYNVGSGVVLDSRAQDEYEECLLKAKVVRGHAPDLIETMRWVPGDGLLRADRHLGRLKHAAQALGYEHRAAEISEAVSEIEADAPQRVRLLLSRAGRISVEYNDFEPVISTWRASLSQSALVADVQETRYKVSARDFYDSERRRIHALTGCDEVLFFNADGFLCEGSFTSVFLEIDGQLMTPDLACGLLPGILREEMIDNGQAVEARLTVGDLKRASRIFVGNSLRGLIQVELTDFARY